MTGPARRALVASSLLLAACGGGESAPPAATRPSPSPASGPWFVDATAESGLAAFVHRDGTPEKRTIDESFGAGVGLVDVDGDGDLDAYLTNGGDPSGAVARDALFRNDGRGRFTDATDECGLGDDRWTYGVCAADVEGDGDLDLFVTNAGPDRLYRNDGSGHFTDVAVELGVAGAHWSTGAAFLDYDLDGDLDLFVVHHIANYDRAAMAERSASFYDLDVYFGPTGLEPESDALFRQESDGTFTDVSVESGIASSAAFGFHALVFDWDRDGLPDIYVANDSQANVLWRNRGDGTFEDVAPRASAALSKAGAAQAAMGVALGDTDGDGFEDLFVTNFSEDYFTLYRGSEAGKFKDATAMVGLMRDTLDSLGWAAFLEDLDGDGDLDAFACAGHVYPQVDALGRATGYRQRNLLFVNDGAGRFALPEGGGGPGLALVDASRGAALGDVDGDGDPDLLVGNLDASPTLLRNESPGRWVRLDLRGPSGGRGQGAVVEGRVGDRRFRRTAGAGPGFLSCGDPALWIGTGPASACSEVVVQWPGGARESLPELPAGADARVEVGRGLVHVDPR